MHGIFGSGFNLVNNVNTAKLKLRHLGRKHEFLFIQYSKPSIKNLANCIYCQNNIQLANNSMYVYSSDSCIEKNSVQFGM